MTSALGKYEKRDSTAYNKRYDEQLLWLKGKVIDLMNNNPEKAKDWFLKEVAAEERVE